MKKYPYKKLSKAVRAEILESMTAFKRPEPTVYEERIGEIIPPLFEKMFKGFDDWVRSQGLQAEYDIFAKPERNIIFKTVVRFSYEAGGTRYNDLTVKLGTTFRAPAWGGPGSVHSMKIVKENKEVAAIIKEFEKRVTAYEETKTVVSSILNSCQTLNQLVETFPESEDHIPAYFIPDASRKKKKQETALVSLAQIKKARKLLSVS